MCMNNKLFTVYARLLHMSIERNVNVTGVNFKIAFILMHGMYYLALYTCTIFIKFTCVDICITLDQIQQSVFGLLNI